MKYRPPPDGKRNADRPIRSRRPGDRRTAATASPPASREAARGRRGEETRTLEPRQRAAAAAPTVEGAPMPCEQCRALSSRLTLSSTAIRTPESTSAIQATRLPPG